MIDDDDDELARYEDEEEGDEYEYPTSTSYESMMEYARSATPRLSTDSADSAPSMSISRSPSASPSPLPSPMEPTHARHASLSKVWTFPTGPAPAPSGTAPREEIDRFFGCLEDVDNSPPIDSKLHSVDSHKNIFAQALAEYDDDLPPFVLPSDVGEIVDSPEIGSPPRTLDIVVEEEVEEEEEATNDDSYDHRTYTITASVLRCNSAGFDSGAPMHHAVDGPGCLEHCSGGHDMVIVNECAGAWRSDPLRAAQHRHSRTVLDMSRPVSCTTC